MATDSFATNSKDASKADTSTFTSYASVPLSSYKLDGSNYNSWASDIKLWLTGQDYADHLTKKAENVPKADCPWWIRIAALLCSVIKSAIHPSIKQIFRAYVTCELVWAQAKAIYTTYTQELYGIWQNLMNLIAS